MSALLETGAIQCASGTLWNQLLLRTAESGETYRREAAILASEFEAFLNKYKDCWREPNQEPGTYQCMTQSEEKLRSQIAKLRQVAAAVPAPKAVAQDPVKTSVKTPESNHATSVDETDGSTRPTEEASAWTVELDEVTIQAPKSTGENPELVKRLEGHQNGVGSVTISPDGRYALSGSKDDLTLIYWDLKAESE